MKYIKHPEFSIVEQLIFLLIDNINTTHPKRLEQFIKDLNSKRDNPIEYYKELIKFAQQ